MLSASLPKNSERGFVVCFSVLQKDFHLESDLSVRQMMHDSILVGPLLPGSRNTHLEGTSLT